jgi:hypothetical protein
VHLTDLLLVAWIAAAVLYDLWAYWALGADATISYRLRAWVGWCPWLLLPLGGLLWHLFGVGRYTE